jgi:hypothetical protein
MLPALYGKFNKDKAAMCQAGFEDFKYAEMWSSFRAATHGRRTATHR